MSARKRNDLVVAAATYDEASLRRLRTLIAETAHAADPDMELFDALRKDPVAREVAMAWLAQKLSTKH